MNLTFVGDRCDGHSPSSGYDQVCSLFPDAAWLSGRGLDTGNLSWYRGPIRSGGSSPQLFHVFYGDCRDSTAPGLIRQRFPEATIVSTVHKPVTVLRGDPSALASIGCSDAILAVSHAQGDNLAELGLTDTIEVIPHGVWTEVFRPPVITDRPRRTVVLVGNYLRDWDSASRVLARLAESGVRVVIVGARGYAPESVLRCHPAVEEAPRLTEPDLARLYDEAAALFLPVVEATASNAVLEAMSAGCPIVSTSSPLVDEYLPDRSDAFSPGDDEHAVDRLMRYIEDPRARALRSSELMAWAEDFDWHRLRVRFADVYADVSRRPRVEVRAGFAADHEAAVGMPVFDVEGLVEQQTLEVVGGTRRLEDDEVAPA